MAKIRRIFPGGNTSNGFYSFHDNIIGLNRKALYILKGMPGGGKSSLMKEIGERIFHEGYSIEYHHCPSDPNSIDGIVICELDIAIVDGTPPHTIEPLYPGLTDKIIDLAEFIDSHSLESNKAEIVKAKINNKYAYRKAFNYFKAAKIIFEEIEDDNKLKLDIKGINDESRKVLEKIFSKREIKIISNGFRERHLFSTAYTPYGFVDYTNTILEWVEDIYYIDGTIGTGKDTLLSRILGEAKLRNYEVEIYHNSLIPEKIESIFIKELDTIITSNKYGEKFAKTKVDLNKYLDNSKLSREDYKMFNALVDKGIESLNGAKENHFILEKAYKPSVDFLGVTKVKEEIFNEILSYI
ncbi:ATP-binding protein [Tissierella praeacuta]|uniref:ATP-binding protein n=1 Tax=Tissierella praeacuta TaxID=43131 RepID=UPI003DA22B85